MLNVTVGLVPIASALSQRTGSEGCVTTSPSGHLLDNIQSELSMILIVFAAFFAGYRGFQRIRKKQRTSLQKDVNCPCYSKFLDIDDELIRNAAIVDAGWSDTLALHP